MSERSKYPLYLRLLFGRFRWQMLHRKRVRKICSSFSVLYEPLSVFLALVLIVASRYLLYSTAGIHYLRQVVARATPGEYLLGLALLITVVFIHEFGHAAAQVRYGLKTGSIGFQLYFYIPAFYADVSNSWSLKPRQRVVVDIGGVYFQSLAASVLCMIYMKTDFVPLLAAVVASDTLCLVSLNPFLRFDGYWLLTDILAVPNLRETSERILSGGVRRLFGRNAEGPPVPIKKGRAIILASYAVVRNCFWLLLSLLIIKRASHIYIAASALFSRLFSQILKGVEVSNWALFSSSVIRSILSALLLLSMASLVVGVALRIFRILRAASKHLVSFNRAQAAGGAARK
jgi:putative peptide zinc metalloprotease protein